MEWRAQYATGIKLVDDQHQKLVSMISQLQSSLAKGLAGREAGNVLKALVDYTLYHFSDEEALMEQIAYADISRHRSLHKALLVEITTILLEIKAGKAVTALQLIDFLKYWLVDHILAEDQQLAAPYASKIAEAKADPRTITRAPVSPAVPAVKTGESPAAGAGKK